MSVESIAGRPPEQSLYLVRPQNLRLRFWSEPIPDTEHDAVKHKRRAVFACRGTQYDLSLTDSRLTQQFEDHIPCPVSRTWNQFLTAVMTVCSA